MYSSCFVSKPIVPLFYSFMNSCVVWFKVGQVYIVTGGQSQTSGLSDLWALRSVSNIQERQKRKKDDFCAFLKISIYVCETSASLNGHLQMQHLSLKYVF